jgi:hypothetical protein
MLIEIFSSQSMAEPFESEWIESVQREYLSNSNRKVTINSIQIVWTGTSANPSGRIEFLISNDCISSVIGGTCQVNTLSNASDATVLFVNPMFRFFKIRYVNNSISSGELTVSAFFD